MTQANSFPFNSHDSYKAFSKDKKAEAVAMNEAIRQEKLAIKQKQRDQNNEDISYKNLLEMREKIQAAQNMRADAKVEASRQYAVRIGNA